jgi:hypothetical protein
MVDKASCNTADTAVQPKQTVMKDVTAFAAPDANRKVWHL